MSNQHYRPDIDGLRAVAIVPVVVFHFFPTVLRNGFLGVDIFFVISGFLITGILLRNMDSGTLTLRQFWGRRIRRLFPVMAAIIITCMLAGYFLLFGDEWRSLSKQSLATLTSTANIFFWRLAGNYWGAEAESMPLLHMWSLSVEEQFYFFFPPLLWLLTQKTNPKITFRTLSLFAVISYLLMLVGSSTHKAASFYLLPTRSWELLVGSLIANYMHHNSSLSNATFVHIRILLGQLLITFAFLFPISREGISMLHTTLIVLGTGLIISAPPSRQANWYNPLQYGFASFIGKISYSWYMWHWPILLLLPKLVIIPNIVLLLISFLAGWTSWSWLENTTRFLPKRQFAITAITLLFVSILAILMPYYLRRPSITYQVPSQSFQLNVQPPYIASFNSFSGDYKTGLTVGNLDPIEPSDILVIGDSHGVMYLPVLIEIASKMDLKLTSFAADGGTWPFFVMPKTDPAIYYAGPSSENGWTPDRRLDFDHARRVFISAHPPKLVILCGRWSFYMRTLGSNKLRNYVENFVREFPSDTRIMIVGQPPTLPFGESGLSSGKLDLPILRAFEEDFSEMELRRDAHQLFLEIATSTGNIDFVSVDHIFNSVRGIRFLENGTILYRDDDHLNYIGARKCLENLEQAIRKSMLPRVSE